MALIACGRKDDPQPPVIRRADVTRDLSVYQDNREVVLRWSFPSITTAGGPLTDVEAVEVWRAPIPLGQEPPGTSARDRAMRHELLEAQGEMLVSLDEAGMADATRGPLLEYRDDLDRWWSVHGDEQPVVMWYAVRTICCKKRSSEYSNIGRLVPETPPLAPEDLVAAPADAGIHLKWEPRSGVTTLVERSEDGESWQQLTPEPVAWSHFLDEGVEQNRRWWYRVRSHRATDGGGRVLGAPTAAVEVDYPDVYPPAPPASLVCLPEAGRVQVLWDEVADAVSYRIERRRNDRKWRLLSGEHHETSLDDSPPPGNISYAVRAVDAAGNASEQAICSTVIGVDE